MHVTLDYVWPSPDRVTFFIAENKMVLAVLDFTGQDGIPMLECCLYPDDLDCIALLKIRFIHFHELNGSKMHLVDLVAHLDHEVRIHPAAYGADAALHFV